MNSAFQNGGIYVIIGGAGGVGEVFSEYVIQTYQAHAVWIGRRARDEQIDAKIARLGALGPLPEYVQADATDLDSLKSAYELIKSRHPRINGLVHSTIVLRDQSLALMSVERMQESLAAKLDVSVRMAQVFGGEALDFMLFFSSFQSFAKAPGQSNYAAGCTFEDAFAHQLRRSWACPVKIVNWGYWGSVGVVATEAMRARMAKMGQASIEAPEAMRTLESLLSGPRDQIILLKSPTASPILPGPPRGETLTWLPSEAASVELPSQSILAAAASVPLPTLPVTFEDAEAMVNATAAVLLCQLQSMDLFKEALHAGVKLPGGLSERYGKWFQESTRVLLERGLLYTSESAILPREILDPAQTWSTWQACKARVVSATGRESDLALVETNLRELPGILCGRRLATDILFPNSSLGQVTGIYYEDPQATYYNEVLAEALDCVLRSRLEAQPGHRLNLFEIGAGTGGTSATVLRHLRAYAGQVASYVYSDISKAFLLHGESAFLANAPYLRTQLFNVERSPAEQGIRPGSFDVVIATNVLHATRNIHRTLHNCKALLKRGGVLLLNEMAMNTLFSHLIFGLLEGWWLYEDPAVRIPGSPGLTPAAWARLLQETGFSPVLFPCEQAHERGQAVIVAQSDGLIRPSLPANTSRPGLARVAAQRPSTAVGRPTGQTRSVVEATTEGSVVRVVTVEQHAQMTQEHVAQLIAEDISVSLKVPLKSIEPDAPFADYGVDSITGVQIIQNVNRKLGIELETTSLFDHPTLDKLAEHIAAILPAADVRRGGAPALRIVTSDTPRAAVAQSVSTPVVTVSEKPVLPAVQAVRGPIAIVGLSGRFARSDSLEEFWQHLANGDDLVEEVSRWNLAERDSGFASGQKGYCRHGSFLSDIDRFDASFFNISGLEARFMDPQQRLFLEEAWKALENAGYAGAEIAGRRCGVYVGVGPGDYAQLLRSAGPPQAFWGNAASVLASRIAYHLDLKGPAVAIDTACSSSLVAIHLACQSLWLAETDLALAGGVFVQSTPNFYLLAGRSGMLSPTGRCHTFDARADGFVPGEGLGAVILRRLDDALADGDHIHAVIRGSGINQDGATNGITAPSALSQEQLEHAVYETFSIDPRRIQVVEAHGTGTELGDPIEFQALTRAFRRYTPDKGYCSLGSVKSNIGHATTAAGMAGLFKLLLALRHRQIPPSIHFDQCNPAIDLERSPFYVNTRLQDWPAPADGGARMAAVSSFGFSGTNAHVVIEEAPAQQQQRTPRPAHLIVLSARTEAQLREQAQRLIEVCRAPATLDTGNLSFTLLLGRKPLEHRLATIASDTQELVDRVSKWCKVGQCPQVYAGHCAERQRQMQAALARYGNQCLIECAQDPAQAGYLERLGVAAELFVQGYSLDFRPLFGDGGYVRVPLPPYPLDRKRYWAEEPSAQTPASSATRHPLLHQNISTLPEIAFTSRFTGEELFLRDHQIQGRRILPGVAHLEAVHAAVRTVSPGTTSIQLQNVVWVRPAEVLDGALALMVRLKPRGDRELAFEITADPDSTCVYSRGALRLSSERAPAPQVALQDVLSRCQDRQLSGETIYAVFSDLGMHYGPAHQAVRALHIGQDVRGRRQVVAELQLPATLETSSQVFELHPSLLDGALQACMGLNVPLTDESANGQEAGSPGVPFGVERLDVYDRCPSSVWVWVRDSEGAAAGPAARKLDVSLCDESGRVLVDLVGFTWRTLAPARGKPFTASTSVTASAPFNEPTAQPVASLWVPGWAPPEADNDSTTAPAIERGDHWVLLAGGFPEGMHTGLQQTLPEAHCEQITLEGAASRPIFELTAIATFQLVQKILRDKPKRPTLLQVVIAANTEARHGLAGLAALLKTATLENPTLLTQWIQPDRELDASLLGELLRAQVQRTADCEIRFRAGRREVRSLRPVGTLSADPQSCAAEPGPWRDQGIYLVTGGLGGLGLIIARSIAAQTRNPRLILVGRSAADARGRAALSDLRALGAAVEYRALDVSDASSVYELIGHITRTYGNLSGVLHSAGVIRDSYIVHKSVQEMEQVLAPKVSGLIQLDEATRELDLDVFALFSSTVGFVGNPGQADYAAANGFMDVYAEYRNQLVAQGRCKGRTLSINWPLWEHGGMQVDPVVLSRVRKLGMVPMATAHGLAVLSRCLRSTDLGPQVVVFVNTDAGNTGARLDHAPDPKALLRRVQSMLADMVCELLQIGPGDIDPHRPLNEYGFDSLNLTELSNRLQARCAVSLSPTIFFEHSTLGSFAAYLAEEHADRMSAALQLARPAAPMAVKHAAHPTPRPTVRASSERAQQMYEPVAVIGISGCFPQAPDIESFWEALKEGRDCIREIPPDRWDWRAFYGESAEGSLKTLVKWGGFVDSMKEFDALFFGIPPREAELMDPQRRLLLTHAWQVVEDAGYAPSSLAGSRTAIYVGIGETGYSSLALAAGKLDGFSTVGLSPSVGPTRVSFQLDLHGPCEPIETACSSSLVAIHRAVNTLRARQCDLAIAGGVNAIVTPTAHIALSKIGMLSPEGRCKTFSADANGYARGEGIGLLLLKRLEDAESAGDPIRGVILHSGENHGGRATSATAPNPKAQAELVRSVYAEARIDPRTITYIETHGTGTRLGDPVEINGLKSAFNALYAATPDSPLPPARCALASVKSNIGHLELAAGVAGVIKVLLQMQHRTLVRTLHCQNVNPLIELQGSPFYLLDRERPWEVLRDPSGNPLPRRAGVSSFGASGVNAHLVLQEYCTVGEPATPQDSGRPQIIVLSARTEKQLQQQARNLLRAIRSRGYGDQDLASIAYTLQVARDAMDARLGLLANDMQTVVAALEGYLQGKVLPPGVYRGQVKGRKGALALFKESEELQEVVDKWVQRGRYDSLVESWVQGLELEWRTLHASNLPRRIHLPTYPFSRESYWIDPAGAAAPSSRALPVADTSPEPVTEQDVWTLRLVPRWRVREIPPRPQSQSPDIAMDRLVLLVEGFAENDVPAVPDTAAKYRVLAAQGEGLAGRYRFYVVEILRALRDVLRLEVRRPLLIQLVMRTTATDAAPRMEGLAALVKTASAENPRVTGQCIMTDESLSGPALEALLLSNAMQAQDHEIRYRQGVREVRELVELSAPKAQVPANAPWREDGVYLITGGLGGLGLIFAREILARVPAARIMLCGRSRLSESRRGVLEALQRQGSVEYSSVDVADSRAVRDLIDSIQRQHGKLTGIIHSAGVILDKHIVNKSDTDAERVLAPKVDGLVNLDEATATLELDFFVAFSSVAGVFGSPGQADYAAGNAFMDRYIEHRRELVAMGTRAGKCLSVDWPLWVQGGMGVSEALQAHFTRAHGIVPLPTNAGIQELYHCLSQDEFQVVIVHGQRDRLTQQPRGDVTSREMRHEGMNAERATTGTLDEVIDILRQALSSWLKVDVADIDMTGDFADFGFDSVSLTEFTLRLNAQYELNLGPAVFLEYPGIPGFCEYLATRHADKLSRTGAPAPGVVVQPGPVSQSSSVVRELPLQPTPGFAAEEPQLEDSAINELQRAHAGAFLERQRRAFASAQSLRNCLLQTSQGINMEVITAGRGRTVLLLPPWAVLASAWMHQVTELSNRYRVVTLNYPGCGRSEYASHLAGFECIARLAFDCLEGLGCDECDLVGWSMGSFVAQLMAASQPQRVHTLTLVNTATRLGSSLTGSDIADITPRLLADFAANVPEGLADTSARRFEFFKASYVPYILYRYRQSLADFDYRSQLARLGDVRTLIVSGADDRLAQPEHSRLMQQSIPRSSGFELPQGGHCIPLQNREWFNARLIEFIDATAVTTERCA